MELVLVRADQPPHRLDHAGEQTSQVLSLMLLHHLEEHLLDDHRVRRTVARARLGVRLHLGLETVAGHDLVEETALVHFVGGERPPGEHHLHGRSATRSSSL